MPEAEQQKKLVSRIKTKKKFWFKIISPAHFGQKELGESYLPSAESAQGRVVDVTLKELTGNVRDQNAYVRFRVRGNDRGALQTEALAFFLTPAYVRRAVKKSTHRVDHYFTGVSLDGRKIIIKGLLITFRKVQRSLRAKLQRGLHDLLAEEVRKNSWDNFLAAVITGRIQQQMKKTLHKYYPLREAVLREVQLFGEKERERKEHLSLVVEEVPVAVSA